MGNGIIGKPIARPKRTAAMESYLPSIMSGLGVTMKHFFKNTKEMAFGQRNDPVLEAFDEGVTTISYPEQKRPYPDRFRGLHRLTLREDGAPRCVACLCCSTACPAQCIHIVSGEYPEGDKRRGYEKYPVEFVIDELRCIFCGFCVEACPCDAIRMDTGQHPVPYDSREQFVYKKDLLMSFGNAAGEQLSENPRHEPASGFPITREGHHLAASASVAAFATIPLSVREAPAAAPAPSAAAVANLALCLADRYSAGMRGTSFGARAGIVVAAGVIAAALVACGSGDGKGDGKKLPAMSKAVAARSDADLFNVAATPGSVPCGASSACPINKASRRMCCNAPGVPPTCKDASKCGQATQFKYSGLLECNEPADCGGKDAVCCLTDDGNRAESSAGKYNRSVCMPRASCRGADAPACASSSDCAKGTVCRRTSLGVGVDVGACLP